MRRSNRCIQTSSPSVIWEAEHHSDGGLRCAGLNRIWLAKADAGARCYRRDRVNSTCEHPKMFSDQDHYDLLAYH